MGLCEMATNGVRRPLAETRFAELSTDTRTVLAALFSAALFSAALFGARRPTQDGR